MDNKRVFFGLETTAPWPAEYPHGRLLDADHRHMTLCFLGNMDFSQLAPLLDRLPLPDRAIGWTGAFDKFIFLPERHPHVVAYHVQWLDDPSEIIAYQKKLAAWLIEHKLYKPERRDWLPHVTISRPPFHVQEWKHSFSKLPFTASAIHLYESHPNSKYEPIWSYRLQPPFLEIEHTADIAFHVWGRDFQELSMHGQIALAFHYPEILDYIQATGEIRDLDDLVIHMNELVSRVDTEIGAPFKAVSFHGKLEEKDNGILFWEMIVDV